MSSSFTVDPSELTEGDEITVVHESGFEDVRVVKYRDDHYTVKGDCKADLLHDTERYDEVRWYEWTWTAEDDPIVVTDIHEHGWRPDEHNPTFHDHDHDGTETTSLGASVSDLTESL